MCLFPAGLSFKDLEQLSLQRKITNSWKSALLSQLQEDNSDPHMFLSLNPDISTKAKNKQNKITQNDFVLGEYRWTKIEKDQDNEIKFQTQKLVKEIALISFQKDFYTQVLQKLKFMVSLGLSVISQIRSNNYYLENLVEFSAISTYGIWQTFSEDYKSSGSKEQINSGFDDFQEFYDFEEMKKWFVSWESNFISCLEPDIIKNMLSRKCCSSEDLIEIMEVLCLTIPTLFKIMPSGKYTTIEVVLKAEKVVNQLDESDTQVCMLKEKLDLFIVGFYLSGEKPRMEEFTSAQIQLDLIREKEQALKNSSPNPVISSEINFATAMYYYKGLENVSVNNKEFNDKAEVKEKMQKFLKQAKKDLQRVKHSKEFQVAEAKITLMQYEIKRKDCDIDKKLEKLKTALTILKNYGSPELLMKAHYLYGNLKFK